MVSQWQAYAPSNHNLSQQESAFTLNCIDYQAAGVHMSRFLMLRRLAGESNAEVQPWPVWPSGRARQTLPFLKPKVCNRYASRLQTVYMRPASLHQGRLRSPLGAGACSCATASPLRGCQSRCLKTSATPQGTQHCAQQLQACAYTFAQGRMPKGQVVPRQRLFVSRSCGQEGWDCQVSSAPEPQSRVPHPFPVKALTLST